MKFLIADDDIASRVGLGKILEKWGYEVITAKDGNFAWDLVQKESPNLVILDWVMPGINGVELCRKIKKIQNENYVYIILLTSKIENKDIITGLNAGADDYIVKPFDPDVFRSRIVAGTRIVEYENLMIEKNTQLEQYSCEMEELAQQRAKQLIHAERMATVGLLSAGIAHEINNPTTFISGNIQTIEQFWGDIEAFLGPADMRGEMDEKLQFILEEMPKSFNGIRTGVKRISKIVNGLKTFCRKDQGTQKLCDINVCIENSLEFVHNILKHHVTIEKDLAEQLPQIRADSSQIEQVFINLFTNAADAMEDQEDRTLSIQSKVENDNIVITVSDNGSGIPEDKLDDIWQPFFTTKPVDKGTGLGLSTVFSIIEKHNGQAKVENKAIGGALFTIILPVACDSKT